MANTNFINECKKRANKNRLGKIIVGSNEITNSDNLQSFDIDSGCYVDGNIIGSVYAKCLKGQFIAVPDDVDLIDKNIDAQIGVRYSDTTTEYINMGKYIVERPKDEITANMSQITAYDSLYTNLDSKYICNIDYSAKNKTVSDLYIDVCNQLGLIPATTTFINSTIPIKDNPFTNGEKNRTVLQTVAKIASSFIDIDNKTNQIDLCWLSQSEEPDYIFHMNDYANVEGGKIVCGPINSLIIKNSQIDDENVSIKDEESIALHGEHSITISEDYVLYNAELRQQAINAIWNRVNGMTYVDCKLTTYYGKPFLKLGDKIRIYTSETNCFDTYVLKHQFTYDGSFTSVISSPSLTEQEIRTKQDIGLQEALRNTQVKVDKQQGEIELLVEEVKQSGIPRYSEAPENPKEEDIYLNTTDNIIYVYKDEKWNATSIDPSTLENYWTKDETKSQIQMTSEGINSNVVKNNESLTNIQKELSELKQTSNQIELNISKIGGINLIENSSWQNKFDKWLETKEKILIVGDIFPSHGESLFWYNTKVQQLEFMNFTMTADIGMYALDFNKTTTEFIPTKVDLTKEQVYELFDKNYISSIVETKDTNSNYLLNLITNQYNFPSFESRNIDWSIIHEPFMIKDKKNLTLSVKLNGYINYGNIQILVHYLDGDYKEYSNESSLETIKSHILKTDIYTLNELTTYFKKYEFELNLENIDFEQITIEFKINNQQVYKESFFTSANDYRTLKENEFVYFENDTNIYKSTFKDVEVTYIESESEPVDKKEELFWYSLIEQKMKRYVYKEKHESGSFKGYELVLEDTEITREDIQKGYKIRVYDRLVVTGKTTNDLIDEYGLKYLPYELTCNISECMLSDQKSEWQPASGENFWGRNFKFSQDGISIENTESGYKRNIDADEDIAKNNTNETIWRLNEDGILVKDLTVNGVIKHGHIVEVARDDGNYYYYV